MRKLAAIVVMILAVCAAIYAASHLGGCADIPKTTEAAAAFDLSTIQKAATHTYTSPAGSYELYRVDQATVYQANGAVVIFHDDGNMESNMPMDQWLWLCINEGQKRCAATYPNFQVPGAWEGYCACFNAAIANCNMITMWMGGHLF